MRKLSILLIAAICLEVSAQWQHSGGPEGKKVTKMYHSQGRVFVGLQYYTDDNGDTWDIDMTPPFTGPVSSFIESGSRILIGGNNSVYSSEDKGGSWVQKVSGLPGDMQVPTLFTDGSTVYLVTYAGELFSSTNGGDSWFEITTNLGKFKIKDMTFINDKIVAYTQNPYTADDAIQWSADAATWTSSNFPDVAVKSLEVAFNKVYAIAQNDGLYISSDNGSTFSNENTGIVSGQLLENNGDLFYFSSDDGVNLLSADGKTLTPRQDGIITNSLNVLISANNILFLGTSIGVYRSGNGGSSWSLANKGLGYQPIADMVSMGDTLFAGTANGGIWRSYSFGLRWVPVGLNEKDVQSMVFANNAIYAVARMNNKVENVYMSDDLGATWEVVGSNIPSSQYASIEAFKNNLILSAFDGVYKLENFTGSWQKIKSSAGSAWSDGTYLYIGGSVMQRTSDLTTWEDLTGLNDGISLFSKDSEYYYAGGIYRGGSIKQMYRSSNGTSFTLFNTGLPNCDGKDLITRKDTTYFAFQELKSVSPALGMNEMTVYQTYPGVTGWTQFQEKLPDVIAGSLLKTNESLLLASEAGAYGLYRHNFKPIPDVPDTVDQIEYPPLETALPSNISNTNEVNIYPNPVSISLTIESIETIQLLRIYDLTGKAMKHSQVNGNSVSIELSDLDAGIYLLKIKGVNGKTETHKIVKQ